MISVKYSINKEDYINYYTYVTWDAPNRRRSRMKYYLRQLAINAAILAILIFTDIFRLNPVYFYIYAGILVVTAALQILYARSTIKKQAEKIAASENNASVFLETQAEITDAGIALKDEISERKYVWKAFVRKQENDEYYFLFTNAIEAIIFPKRIFKMPDERKQFEKLLSQHLSFDAEVGYLIKE